MKRLDRTQKPTGGARQVLGVLAVTVVMGAYLFVWAIGTQPTVGDESRHYRYAVNCYDAGHRVAYDPMYPPGRFGHFKYWGGALWHLGLAKLWVVTGGPSVMVAQAYHALFFVLLGVFTYLTGRELYGHRGGLWAWALVVTVPMNILFTMTYYVEVPMLAFLAMACYFLVRRWAVPLGAAMGAMYLIKCTSAIALVVPLFVVAAVYLGQGWRKRLALKWPGAVGRIVRLFAAAAAYLRSRSRKWLVRTLLAGGVFGLVILPDVLWRHENLGRPVVLMGVQQEGGGFPHAVSKHFLEVEKFPQLSESHQSIVDPRVLVRFLGLSGLFALIWATAASLYGCWRAAWSSLRESRGPAVLWSIARIPEKLPKEVLLFGLPLLVYVAAFCIFLRHSFNVRYLQPATVPAALLLAGRLGALRWSWAKAPRRALHAVGLLLLVGTMAGQFLTAPYVVRRRRALEPAVRDAFEWIKANVPEGARIFYIEENLTTVTGRPMMWGSVGPRTLFCAKESAQTMMMLSADVRYIAVHPTRRVPTSSPDVIPTAYPETWIRSLEDRPYLAKVYDKGGFLLYFIACERVPEAWRRAAWGGPQRPAAGGGGAADS